MTDPSDALPSFQAALASGQMRLQPGALDPDIYLHVDRANGAARFIYFRVENRTITAMAMLVSGPPLDGRPCFHIGWAVPTAYRNHGRAKGAITAAIAELRHGLARTGITAFYVEAIIGTDNPASQRVAAQTMLPTPTPMTDSVSGLPALQYLLPVSPSSP